METEQERDSGSAGNTSASASARGCKRLTVNQTTAGAIWSALPVPVGHLPTLGKASSTNHNLHALATGARALHYTAGGIVNHVPSVVKRIQHI